eukprot:gene2533-2901_t
MYDLSDFAQMTRSDSDSDNETGNNNSGNNVEQVYEQKTISIHEEELVIREFHFSTTNAGYVWPSTFYLIDYILEHRDLFANKKVIELGSGTGILSLYLKKKGIDITSSDIDNPEVSENIIYNQSLNNIQFNHIPHTWGDEFPKEDNDFDVVIASDIILYVSYFEKLMVTLRQLMDHKKDSFMIMAYKRKLYDSKKFFILLSENGFEFEIIGSKMWKIQKKRDPLAPPQAPPENL